MGTGGGAYSWHTYSTALNVLGAAKIFPFSFRTPHSGQPVRRCCRTDDARPRKADKTTPHYGTLRWSLFRAIYLFLNSAACAWSGHVKGSKTFFAYCTTCIVRLE